jgi:AbrB family looped-hinge helix DNA binding protein
MQLVTINEAGYVQIPENIRQRLGLHEQSKLAVKIHNGQLILSPVQEEANLYHEGQVLVSDAELFNDVTTVIEQLRTSRDLQNMSW